MAADDNAEPAELVLEAGEYHGELDWFTFSGASVPTLRSEATPVEPRTITRTVIPAPVTYSGQPANRYWAFEDSRVSLGAMSSSVRIFPDFYWPTSRCSTATIGSSFQSICRWGSVSMVRSLTITDTFGVTSDVVPAADLDEKWTMFGISGVATAGS